MLYYRHDKYKYMPRALYGGGMTHFSRYHCGLQQILVGSPPYEPDLDRNELGPLGLLAPSRRGMLPKAYFEGFFIFFVLRPQNFEGWCASLQPNKALDTWLGTGKAKAQRNEAYVLLVETVQLGQTGRAR